jgi:hypothetical protein
LLLSLCALGSHPSSYIRWIPSTRCIFGGSAAALKRYIPAYLEVFKQTLAANRFVGVDQRLFAAVALQHPQMVIFQPPDQVSVV